MTRNEYVQVRSCAIISFFAFFPDCLTRCREPPFVEIVTDYHAMWHGGTGAYQYRMETYSEEEKKSQTEKDIMGLIRP